MIDLFFAVLWQLLWGYHGVGFWPILVMVVIFALRSDRGIDTESKNMIDWN